MNQHKFYLLTLSAIFLGQAFFAGVYILSSDGSTLQQTHIKLLQAQNNTLSSQLEAAVLPQTKGRQIASIHPHLKSQEKEIDLTQYYFTQLEQFKKEKNQAAALKTIEKIQNTSPQSEILAQAEYEKINLICNQKLESDCMNEIELIVSQFPDSNWTAKSLLLLSHYYYKQNRTAESKSLIKIIRTEFKAYNDLSRDIQQLSSKNL